MAIAAQRYALEYQYFPPALRYENEGTVTQVAWDWITTMDGQLISPGPLWSFADDAGAVQQCPGYHGATNFKGDPFTGYNYNTTWVGGEGQFMVWGWKDFRPGVRYSACRRTARVAMFGDGGYAGGANKFMRAPLNREGDLPKIYAGGQAYRHRKSTNAVYLDGHVSVVGEPFRGTLATESLLTEEMDYPRNGFLSDDDRAYDPR
jgi:prepilin-type processing-associated H-X9-DG protein